MDLKKQVIKGIGWSAIDSWGRQVIGSAIFFLLARLLGPESYGLVALASVFLAFMQLFVDQGFSEAIVQRKSLDREHLDSAFWANFGISLVLAASSILCATPVANFFHEPRLALVICWLSPTFLLAGLGGVHQAILQREMNFQALAIRSLVAVVFGGLIAVVMAIQGLGVWSLVGQQLANSTCQLILLLWTSSWQPKLNFSVKHFRELVSFGSNVLGLRILDFANRRLDDFLIGFFLGPVALGYYSLAYRILLIMTELMTGVTVKVAMPTFSRLQKQPKKLERYFLKATQLTSLISFPTFLGLSALAPELFQVFFGSKWNASIPVMQILAIIGVIHSVFYFNGALILAMGKPTWRLLMILVHTVINATAFYISVTWGIVAVASSYVLRAYLLSPIDIWVMRKLISLEVKAYLAQYVSPLVGSLVMVSVILITKTIFNDYFSVTALLITSATLGFISYIAMIRILAPKLFQEIVVLSTSALPIFSKER